MLWQWCWRYKWQKESDKMLLNIIGYALCALGGGIIGRIIGQRDDSTGTLILACFAIICLMAGVMAVVL